MRPTPRRDPAAAALPGRSGLVSLSRPVLREVLDAVWYETREMREAIHRLRRTRSCDTRFTIDGGGRLIGSGECLCRDFLFDMLVEADRYLVRRGPGTVRNPPGAVRVHVRTRAGDWLRSSRLARGAQARTDRIRTGTIAAQLPDPYHRALLEYLVLEAGSLAPLGGDADLHRRLSELAAKEFGGSVEEHLPRVTACLPAVEAAGRGAKRVRASAESDDLITWWERYVELPLGRRERPDGLPLDLSPADRQERATEADPGVVAVCVVLEFAARRADEPRASALSEAIDELVRCELLPESAARQFLGDPSRVRDAVAQMDLLLAA